eukprot:TRINITY_DN3516_c0_g1_i1.p1 TRINITY_DN3516_c0_g1~~TRINITY_DN3516_c0_g1_i1.p1  ORF type:complete len:519 (-),score=123.32 TRINITY_DN3516_c0_g1_i1:134-1690(-)
MRLLELFFLVALFLVNTHSFYTSPYDFVDTRGQWGVAFNGSYPSAEFFIVNPNSPGAVYSNETDNTDYYSGTYDERADPAFRLNQTFQLQLLRLYEVDNLTSNNVTNGTATNGTGADSVVWSARPFPASVETSTNTLSVIGGSNRLRNVSFIYNFFLKGSVYVTYLISENSSALTDQYLEQGNYFYPFGSTDRRIRMYVQVLNWFFQTSTSRLAFEMLYLVNNSNTAVPPNPLVLSNFTSPSATSRPSRSPASPSRTSRPSLRGSESVFASFSTSPAATPSSTASPLASVVVGKRQQTVVPSSTPTFTTTSGTLSGSPLLGSSATVFNASASPSVNGTNNNGTINNGTLSSEGDDNSETISYALNETSSAVYARLNRGVNLDGTNTVASRVPATISSFPDLSTSNSSYFNYVNVVMPRFNRSAVYGPNDFNLGIPNVFLYGAPNLSSIGNGGKIAIAVTIGVAGILACCAVLLFIILLLVGAKIVEAIRRRRVSDDRSAAYRSKDEFADNGFSSTGGQ